MSGCFALTSAPLSATTRTTRPARSDLISLNSFIASISPIDLADGDLAADLRRTAREPGAGERVPDAGQRRLDRRARRAAAGSGPVAGVSPAPAAVGVGRPRRRPAPPGAGQRDRLAQDERRCRRPRPRARSGRERSRSSAEAVDRGRAAGVGAGGRPRRAARSSRASGARAASAGAGVVGHAVPPPEDEGGVLAAEPERVAERRSGARGAARDVRASGPGPSPAGSGSSRLIVGGTHPVADASGSSRSPRSRRPRRACGRASTCWR